MKITILYLGVYETSLAYNFKPFQALGFLFISLWYVLVYCHSQVNSIEFVLYMCVCIFWEAYIVVCFHLTSMKGTYCYLFLTTLLLTKI